MKYFKKLLGFPFYDSKLDQFLAEYDRLHPKWSLSQQKERDNYADVFAKRDGRAMKQSPKESFIRKWLE